MNGKQADFRRFDALCRERAERGGPAYWRGLQELAETDEFKTFVANEFPHLRDDAGQMVNRRQFLTMLAASMAVTGLHGCTRQPPEAIVPRARRVEYAIPGRPRFYATALNYHGFAQPVLVESHDGRPTKIEGNPEHPSSLGATSAITQALIWGLYDPDRSKVVTHRGNIATWEAFQSGLKDALKRQAGARGAGLRILCEPTSSPTLLRQKAEILSRFPEARWHVYEPFSRDAVLAGGEIAFGRPLAPRHEFGAANVVVSLDADFLLDSPTAVRDARAFVDKRRVRADRQSMNRLYVAETMPSITGAAADHRLSARPDELIAIAAALASELGLLEASSVPPTQDRVRPWVRAVSADLQRNRGDSLIVAGDAQPAAIHAMVHAMNDALGNVDRTVTFAQPVDDTTSDSIQSLRELTDALRGDHVDVLIILGGNPARTAPFEFEFVRAIRQARLSVRLGVYEDETSAACLWHVPASHDLEIWSDLRTTDGTAGIVQPLIDPLYNNKSVHEFLDAIDSNDRVRTGLELVKETWKSHWPDGEFEAGWQKSVHDGFIAHSTLAREKVELRREEVAAALEALLDADPRLLKTDAVDVLIAPDPMLRDGRYANNPFLQELPRPITKLTWDGAALMSPATAERLGVMDEQFVEVRAADRALRVPAWRVPGHADACLTLYAGHGRTSGGSVCRDVGVNAFELWTSATTRLIHAATVRPLNQKAELACTQLHHSMEGRYLIRTRSLADFASQERQSGHRNHDDIHLSLYPEHKHGDNAWGMVIDLTACIGCNACEAACQVENNIPVVGREEVRRGREMSWIRIDRYFAGPPEAPGIEFQPVPCMHCENAPCEVVCPVGATVHSNDGLNEMIYNRCIGTRYCSNNCPYKVRRFNFFQYADDTTPTLELMRNPDVSVRYRGVMEKCTYCVQRISAARIAAKKENRSIRDGDVVTACQAACPTQAIVFGDLNDPTSRVARLQAEPHRYALLEELNTRPHTTYLARVRNPNPELEGFPV